jgi:hypothetical protein
MTNAIINGKRRACSIEEKARLLLDNIVDVHEAGLLAVISNSDRRIAYAVYHDGNRSTSCACTHCRSQKNPGLCSYRRAVDMKLANDRRAWYTEVFDIYTC